MNAYPWPIVVLVANILFVLVNAWLTNRFRATFVERAEWAEKNAATMKKVAELEADVVAKDAAQTSKLTDAVNRIEQGMRERAHTSVAIQSTLTKLTESMGYVQGQLAVLTGRDK